MRNATGIAAYRQTSVLGSSREQLVVLMYDHLLASLRRARQQIRDGDIEGRVTNLARASDIITELLATMDFERGGDVASRLSALYAYFLNEISMISRHPDADRLDRMTSLVTSLHESWVAAVANAQSLEQGLA
jgi:flagellar protein FliS